jgi:hypothetical protein
MKEPQVITIETHEDLKRILFIQRKVTTQAKEDLLNIINDSMLDQDPSLEKTEQVRKFMREEGELLGQYADRPTLTEWKSRHAPVAGAETWGATFAVALLIGELLFEPIRASYPAFAPALRSILIAILQTEIQALKDAEENDEAFDQLVMRFNVTGPDGKLLQDEEVKKQIRSNLQQVIQAIITAGMEYGLFVPQPGAGNRHVITKRGQRVLFHLMDVQKFVDVMAEAHKRFQSDVTALTPSKSVMRRIETQMKRKPNKIN